MSECEISERSARGYCPGDEDGHRAELEGLLEVEPETATVDVTTEPTGPPTAGELPATGLPLEIVLAAALLLIAIGAALGRVGRR